MIWIISFLVGVSINLLLPLILSPVQAVTLLVVVVVYSLLVIFRAHGFWGKVLIFRPNPYINVLTIALSGFVWLQYVAAQEYAKFLPEFYEGKELVVYGRIVSIKNNDSILSDKALSTKENLHVRKTNAYARKKLKKTLIVDVQCVLELYQATKNAPLDCNYKNIRMQVRVYDVFNVHLGEQWRMTVRAKAPRGFSNPGGFDYVRHLFAQRIHATAYLKSWPKAHRIKSVSNPVNQWFSAKRDNASLVDAMGGNSEAAGLLQALLLGQRERVKDATRETMQTTGTAHLLAISGLHIAVAGGFGYFLVFSVCFVFPLLTRFASRKVIAMFGALPMAVFYAALSGFALTTQRALLMSTGVVIMLLLGRRIHRFRYWGIALFLMLLFNPLLIMRTGFWFSFVAVAILLWVHVEYRLSWWRRLWFAQFALFFGMAPLYAAVNGHVSMLAPLANMIIIPIISFVVIPFGLSAVLLWSICEPIAISLLSCCEYTLEFCLMLLNAGLQYFSKDMIAPRFVFGITSDWLVCLSFAVAVVMTGFFILPGKFPGKPVAALVSMWIWLPIIMPLSWSPWLSGNKRLANGEFSLTQLDVGQGTAIAVRTANYLLLYDLGARFSDRFNAAESVILPYLDINGLEQVDLAVVSHSDNDHAGGVEPLLDSMRVKAWMLGESISLLKSEPTEACLAGRRWFWDGVEFTVMHPDQLGASGNDSSCVIQIRTGVNSVLLTGDISTSAENKMIRRYGKSLRSEIITAPHHGSKTSSGAAFIEAVLPQWVLVSAGYRNRYGHPADSVLARYRSIGAQTLNSAEFGAIRFIVGPSVILGPYCDRYRPRRLWQNVDNTAICAQSL